jgi:hypothetical protein
MARPIKETPVLTGRDATRFAKQIKQNADKKTPAEDYRRAKKAFDSITIVEG